VLLRSLVAVQVTLSRALRRRDPERGQTTAEYALVLVGVAAIALLVVAWASDTNKIGRLLDGVLDSILDRIP
jgi:Flp pilus assembly pilin Flp